MQYSPLVSIIIPCYNSEKYIADALHSCFTQTYKNIEIIIVDDGSTDNTKKVLKQFVKKYSNIKVLTQTNQGAPAARNLAFKHTKGDYVQYLDADDILHERKIETQIDRLRDEKDSTLIFCRSKIFTNDINQSIDYDSPIAKDYGNPKQFLIDLWCNTNSIYPHAWLTPRPLIEQSEGWDETILKNQDGIFFAKLIASASQILFEEQAWVYYRVENENSISRKKSHKYEKSRLESYKHYENIFADDLENPAVKRALAIFYSDFIFYNYPENKDLVKIADEKIKSFGFDQPINVKIDLYRKLSPIFGIYGSIYIHKLLSRIKQTAIKIVKKREIT